MFFEYERPTKKKLQEYEVIKDNQLFISGHDWEEMINNFSKDEITDFLSSKIEGLPFPYPSAHYSQREVRRDWDALRFYNITPVEGEWAQARCGIGRPSTYRGKAVYIPFSQRGLKVSNQFTEPFRFEVSFYNQKKSPIDRWTKKGKKQFFRPLFSMMAGTFNQGLGARQLVNAMQLSGSHPTQFKPSAAKCLYDFFGAKRILDFSMGWGDRLVGFLASGAESYIGIDPNTKLHEPYRQIEAYCNMGKSTRFICAPAEDVDFTDIKVDFVFTSPPYFDLERYSEEDTQSWVRYPTADGWLEGFLFPTLKKCWGALEEGGRICVNISDTRDGKVQVVQPMLEYMDKLGAVYEGVVGYRIQKRILKHLDDIGIYCEPIFVWSKGEAPEPKWAQNFFGV